MLRIVIFSGSQAKLGELHSMVTKELINDGVDCNFVFFSDTKKLMNYLGDNSHSIDIVLFDLYRKSQSSIRLATTISTAYPNIDLLLVSKPISVPDDADDTVTLEGPDYILSTPVSLHDLDRSFAKAVKTFSKYESGKITLCAKGQIFRLRLSYIDYIVSSNRLLTFHGGERELCVYGKLDEIEEQLEEGFLRCHQSYLVNMSRILTFNKNNVQLYSGIRIPVSKSRFSKAYADFLGYAGMCD